MRRPNSNGPAPGEPIPIEYLPPDLAPIPYGADVEDEEAIRTALWINYGNTQLAAEALGCRPGALARRIEELPDLKADRDAARRMIVDRAEAVIVEQLTDETSIDRRDESAKFVLTTLGRSLGWGSQATAPTGFSMSDGTKTLSIRWQGESD